MVVQFSPFDMQFIVMFAARQRAVQEALGSREMKHQADRDGFDIHLAGAMGECAVARVLKIRVDTSLVRGGDDGVDLTYRGKTLQVKAFCYCGPKLQVIVKDVGALTAELLVATRICTPASAEVLGWISTEEFRDIATRRDFGYGSHLIVDQSALKGMALLTGEVDAREHL
jgi:hypothetical protein